PSGIYRHRGDKLKIGPGEPQRDRTTTGSNRTSTRPAYENSRFFQVVNPPFTLIRGKSGAEHSGASMRPVPWHVKGVHPDARDVAREAARRSGVSVGTWLNAIIIKAADQEVPGGEPEAPVPHAAGPVHHPRAAATADDPVVTIGRQIDELKF